MKNSVEVIISQERYDELCKKEIELEENKYKNTIYITHQYAYAGYSSLTNLAISNSKIIVKPGENISKEVIQELELLEEKVIKRTEEAENSSLKLIEETKEDAVEIINRYKEKVWKYPLWLRNFLNL